MAVRQKSLSNRTVAALKVDRDTVFWDRALPGFGVRVYPSGGKVYYIAQARERTGKKLPKRVTVGRHDVLSADQARQRAALILARIRAGEEPLPLAACRQGERRPDRGGPGGALFGRACRSPAQAEDAGARPRRAPQPHPARIRQDARRGGRAEPRHRAPTESERPSGDSEQGRQGPVAHVQAGRRLGPGAGRFQSLPVGRAIPRASPRTLPDRCRVRPPREVTGRVHRRRARLSGSRGGDPPADADRLPQERDPHPALDRSRPRRRASSTSPTASPGPVRFSFRQPRCSCSKRCRDGRTVPGCFPATIGTDASAPMPSTMSGKPSGPGPG